MAGQTPLVMEAPVEEEMHPPQPEPQPEPAPAPEPEQQAPPRSQVQDHISADGRTILREGMAQMGLGRDLGNRLADWLDKQQDVKVTVTGRLPEPPMHIFSTPDADPIIERRDPFTENG